jgi:hypothetical protein
MRTPHQVEPLTLPVVDRHGHRDDRVDLAPRRQSAEEVAALEEITDVAQQHVHIGVTEDGTVRTHAPGGGEELLQG